MDAFAVDAAETERRDEEEEEPLKGDITRYVTTNLHNAAEYVAFML